MNKIILLGNLTRDPELLTFTNSELCKFTLAVTRKYGEKEETIFIDCNAWSKLGELCNKYLQKGSQALVEGRLATDSWEDKETGQKRSKHLVVCEDVRFLSKRNEEPAAKTEEAEEDTPF